MQNLHIKQAVILCAGLGTRMRPLTNTTPKPLVKVNNKPMLDYTVDNLAAHGVTRIVCNSHYLAEQITYKLLEYKQKFPTIEFIESHEPVILDSGGGVKNALKYLNNEPFFVINGDIIIMNDPSVYTQLEQNFNSEDCLMLTVKPENAVGYDKAGDISIINNKVVKYEPGMDNPLIFTGIQLFNPGVFANFKQDIFSLREIYFGYHTKAVTANNTWLHIGTEIDLKKAEIYLNGRK